MGKSRTIRALMALIAISSTFTFATGIKMSDKDIAGTVISSKGPEAGVWVIAKTKSLPTGFSKIVVTDDKGRFLIPDLPKGDYEVWVRGYGLVDSEKVKAAPGQELNLNAIIAPSAKEAAYYYPGVYWYSLLEMPKKEDFPGTGDSGNGIPTTMKDQRAWIDTMKQGCQSCHALGSLGMRNVPELFKKKGNGDSYLAWAHRTQAGQAMWYMALVLARLGPEKGLQNFANWTDSIEKGALPFDKPTRPVGVERNAVYSMWDWSSPKAYLHDSIATDKRDPTLFPNGLIYGAPEESTDLVPVLDPVTNKTSEIRMPYLDPKTASQSAQNKGESAYWGAEKIWDGHTSIHNLILDESGKVWFAAKIRNPPDNPDFCRKGSDHPSAKAFPLNDSGRHITMYDPKTKEWKLINTCFPTHHVYFGHDANNTLWTSAGPPNSGVVGWLNTKMYLATGDEKRSQGWTPFILDTNGNGKRDDYVEPNAPLDPSKDTRVITGLYGMQPSPVDDTIWGQSMDVGFSRMGTQPGYLVHVIPGVDPSTTALSEIFQPPEGTFGPRGIDVDSKGLVWTVLSSGHMASFNRKLCKGPISGPSVADGKHCPEGWKTYRFPGPQFKGLDPKGSADHAYYVWVDLYNTLGLGKDVPIASLNGGESLLALVNGKFVNLHVPYPMGFFTKNVDGRIDDPKTGWKGRGIWTTSGTRTNFHSELPKEESYPKVFKVQIRPNPLAN